MSKASVLVHLKEATHTQHVALEHELDLLNPTLTRLAYIRLLQRFHGFYAPLEAQLLRIQAWHAYDFDIEARLKTPLLDRDLSFFGVHQAQSCARVPKVQTLADAAGVLYVLEGATLGGHLISRHLQRRFGFAPDHGGAFFANYGSRVGEMWRTYGQFAVRVATDMVVEHAMIAAAQTTFTTLHQWLEER